MQPFETYEQVATFLLNDFASHLGLTGVQGKQEVAGRVTTWEIDAKGVKDGGDGFIVIECRRYTQSKPTQEAVAGLAYRICDLGADGGIIVTPLGLQEGAARIATAEGILSVQLDATSTTSDYVLRFLNHVMVGRSLTLPATAGMSAAAEVTRRCRDCGEGFVASGDEQRCPACDRQSPLEPNGG